MNNINTRESKCGENVFKPKLARMPVELRSEYTELNWLCRLRDEEECDDV